MRLRSAFAVPWNPSGMDQPGPGRAQIWRKPKGTWPCKF